MFARLAVCVSSLSMLCAAPAIAGTKDDVRDLQARMGVVEQAVDGQSASLTRIGELEAEIQQLTGQVEELSYRLDLANQRLEAISAVLAGDPTMNQAAALGGAAASGEPVNLVGAGDPIADEIAAQDTTDSSGSIGGGDVELPLDPSAAYIYASGLLLQGDYQRAKEAFSLYVEAFPNNPRTPDAKFRLGEIHLALGENAAAADVFINHIRTYPNDPKAAEAYLKLGTAFSKLEKPTEACRVFKTMKTKFPDAAPAVVQRADLEMARIDCQ